MIKKLSLVMSLFFIFTFSGCSKSKPEEVKNISPEKTTVEASVPDKKEAVTSLPVPSFDKSAPMKATGQSVPVLMYHSIAYEKGNAVRLPVESFESQMKYLKENGYYTITMDELYNYLVNNTPVPQKSVVLTFDDGYDDNYKAMYPILKKYGFRATIFVITSYIDHSPAYLTSEQLKELDKNGIDIESHTVNHENLKETPKVQQIKTLVDSKNYLEKLLNKKVNYLAYPYGQYTKDTVEFTKEAGYTMAFTTDGRWSSKKNGMLTLDRVYISSFHAPDVFGERISNPNYKSLPQ